MSRYIPGQTQIHCLYWHFDLDESLHFGKNFYTEENYIGRLKAVHVALYSQMLFVTCLCVLETLLSVMNTYFLK